MKKQSNRDKDSDNRATNRGYKHSSTDPIKLIESIDSIIKGRFSGNSSEISPEQKDKWNERYNNLEQGRRNTNE